MGVVGGIAPSERQLHLARIGTTIRVQELGEGPPVVFVHGGSINGTCWAPLVALLDDFRCIVIDRRSCRMRSPAVRHAGRLAGVATVSPAVSTVARCPPAIRSASR